MPRSKFPSSPDSGLHQRLSRVRRAGNDVVPPEQTPVAGNLRRGLSSSRAGLIVTGLLRRLSHHLSSWARRVMHCLPRPPHEAQRDAEIEQRKSQSQARLKTQITTEIQSLPKLEGRLRFLFRQLGSNWDQHFVVVFDLRDGQPTLLDSRGLSDQSKRAVVVDQAFVRQSAIQGCCRIENRLLRGSNFLASLMPADRRKAQELFGLYLGNGDQPVCLVLTTRLMPASGDRAVQLAFTAEAFEKLADVMPVSAADDVCAAEQVSADVRRDVPTGTEQPSTAPLDQIGRYLKYLTKSLGVDRVILHAPHALVGSDAARLVECNVNLPPGVLRTWRQHEAALLFSLDGAPDFEVLTPAKLSPMGVNSLIGVAVLVAVRVPGKQPAWLLITDRGTRQFTKPERRLIIGCARCVEEMLTDGTVRTHTSSASAPLTLPAPHDATADKSSPHAAPAEVSTSDSGELSIVKDPTSAKLDFLARMTHELRTPVNGILGMTQLIMDTNLTSEQREYLQIVQTSSESLVSLVNSVLDHSKLESGRLELEASRFSLRDTLIQALRSISFLAHAKRLELCCDVAPELPDAFVGDALRLRQVIVNLVGNAIKFTERGSVILTCAPEVGTAQGTNLHLCVRDTGIGIPSDKLQAIFDDYVQADSATARNFGGTGLGLSISRKLVEMMDGKIWVESQLGAGSQFHFTLRLAVDHANCVQPNRHKPAVRRVLLVDDSPTGRTLCENWCRRQSGQLEAVASVAEALLVLVAAQEEQRPFDALVLDLSLPHSDATGLLEFIDAIPARKRPAVVLLKSPGNPDQELQESRTTGHSSLLKPLDERELFRCLCELSPESACVAHNVSRTAAVPSQRTALQPLRILVADDHPINQRCAEAILQNAGHQVSVVGNGRDALQALETAEFDVVLMDMLMPVMDGLTATSELRRRELKKNRRIPIIALTGLREEHEQTRCREAGVDAVLTKPLDTDTLLNTLAEIVASSRSAAPTAVKTSVKTPATAGAPKVKPQQPVRPAVQASPALDDELQQMFLEMVPDELQRIRTAVDTNDARSLQDVAHSLKGAASCLGLSQVEELLYQLECMGRTRITPEAEALLQSIEEELQHATENW